MWIMVAGPYRAGNADEETRAQRLKTLNQTALQLREKGHIPIIGLSVALPIVEAAGQHRYDEIMMPLCLELAEKCDAILRLPGASAGSDQEVESFTRRHLPIFTDPNDIPSAALDHS